MAIRAIKTVAVVGAGTMGQGIALSCSLSGYHVLLFDVNNEFLQRSSVSIEKNLDQLVEKSKISTSQKADAINRIRLVSEIHEVRADIVIEAVIEDLEVKRKLFADLEEINTPDTIFASNTSSLSITKIAANLQHKERFVGIHFFNPAHLMKLVEVIEGQVTDHSLVPVLNEFVKSLNKIPVIAKDSPGFIVNRVARHYYLESLKLVEDQIADVASIDKLMRSAGFKMGPFELMDLIGVDINLAVSTSVYHAMGNEERFKPSAIQQELVKAGNLGRKTGKGFYDYQK